MAHIEKLCILIRLKSRRRILRGARILFISGSSFHFTRWEKKITSSGNTDVLLMYQMTVIVLIPQSNVLFLKNCAGERASIKVEIYFSQSDSLFIRQKNEQK